MNAVYGSHIYFNDPTNEEVSQYDLHRYVTGRTSCKDNADELRDSLNNSTLQFVGNMSDNELNGQTLKYFVIQDPPVVFNPYYLPALCQELTNHQRATGTC